MGDNLIFIEKIARSHILDLMEHNGVEGLSVTKIEKDSFITEQTILHAGCVDLWLNLINKAGGNFIIKVDTSSTILFTDGFDELYKINK